MNTESSAIPESFDSPRVAPAAISATRPMYWSVRRELGEYRSIYIAPLAAAAFFVFGFLISTIHLPAKMRTELALGAAQQHQAIAIPYDMAAAFIMGAAFLVGIFYSLDALYGERRDRSILFWKSLPVSDATTVLAKASIPIVVIPLLAFVVVVATQCIMLLLSSAVLLASGVGVATLWTQLGLFQKSLLLLYHLVTVHMLWYAPLYAWMLLVSSWAPRAAFLWAFLPPFAISVVEKIAFNSWQFASMLQSRVTGGAEAVPVPGQFPMDNMTEITPGRFLSTPGLWIGLGVAAAFLFATMRIRRRRGPI